MSMPAHYGEEWRDWPGGCPCHGEGSGYMSSYRELFDTMFERLWYEVRGQMRYMLLAVEQTGDAGELFAWQFGYFSWTPYGDLWEPSSIVGTATSRARAEADCRHAAALYVERMQAQ